MPSLGFGLKLHHWRWGTSGSGGSVGQFFFNQTAQSGLIILLEDI
jgi:hypothetical protein